MVDVASLQKEEKELNEIAKRVREKEKTIAKSIVKYFLFWLAMSCIVFYLVNEFVGIIIFTYALFELVLDLELTTIRCMLILEEMMDEKTYEKLEGVLIRLENSKLFEKIRRRFREN